MATKTLPAGESITPNDIASDLFDVLALLETLSPWVSEVQDKCLHDANIESEAHRAYRVFLVALRELDRITEKVVHLRGTLISAPNAEQGVSYG